MAEKKEEGKKSGGERQKPSREGQRPKSAVETIMTLIMSGELGDEAKEKAKGVLSGDSNFFSWWQRKKGESLASTDNALKAVSLIAAYMIYRHVDPMEGSKVDDAAVLLAALALGTLLVIPQSTELGAHFHDFETKVLLACHDLTANDEEKKKRENILKWVHDLSHKQEARISAMLGKIPEDAEGKAAFKAVIMDDGIRTLLHDLAGEDTKSMTFEEGVEKVKEVIKKHWPEMKTSLYAIDSHIGGAMKKINDDLERHWYIKSSHKRKHSWFSRIKPKSQTILGPLLWIALLTLVIIFASGCIG